MIDEVIVVEGKKDAQAVRRALGEVNIIWTHGFGITAEQIIYLKRMAQERGVLVCTDPDRPGQLIRERIEKQVPNVRHVFVSKAKACSSRNKSIGIEHASDTAIQEAFARVRTTPRQSDYHWNQQDLTDLGLNGHPRAAVQRRWLGQRLQIGDANAKQFVRRLNTLRITRAEFLSHLAAWEDRSDD